MIFKPDNFIDFYKLPDPTAKLMVGCRQFECSKVYLGSGTKIALVKEKEPSCEATRGFIRGFKAFNNDWTCRVKQYRIGETFKEDVKLPIPCEIGIHFCLNLVDIFHYYEYDFTKTKVAEVEATGDVTTLDGEKFCTNELKILREVEPDVILDEVRNIIYWELYQKLPTSILSETLRKLEHVDDRVYDGWRKLNDK